LPCGGNSNYVGVVKQFTKTKLLQSSMIKTSLNKYRAFCNKSLIKHFHNSTYISINKWNTTTLRSVNDNCGTASEDKRRERCTPALSAMLPSAALGRLIVDPFEGRELPRVAAFIDALVVVVTAVAFLAGLYNLITTESAERGIEAVALLIVDYRIEDVANITDAALGELAVVRPVTGCC
jgi:hypothetical protein